jgi:hypothetical protein
VTPVKSRARVHARAPPPAASNPNSGPSIPAPRPTTISLAGLVSPDGSVSLDDISLLIERKLETAITALQRGGAVLVLWQDWC